jgi:WD40 repeat protein
VASIALSPDGSKLASTGPRDFFIWDTTTGAQIHKLPGHSRGIAAFVGFTSDGRHLLGWGIDDVFRRWDVVTGKVIVEATIPADDGDPKKSFLYSMGPRAFSPSRDLLGLGTFQGPNNTIQVFDVASRKSLREIPTEGGRVIAQAISPDGRLLLASTAGKQVKIFLPNGMMRTSSVKDQAINLWDIASGQLRFKLALPDGGAGPVAFSRDGNFYAAALAAPGNAIRIWDVEGKEVGTIRGYRGTVAALAFTPDGNRLISGMEDTTALVWDLTVKR